MFSVMILITLVSILCASEIIVGIDFPSPPDYCITQSRKIWVICYGKKLLSMYFNITTRNKYLILRKKVMTKKNPLDEKQGNFFSKCLNISQCYERTYSNFICPSGRYIQYTPEQNPKFTYVCCNGKFL